MSHFEIVTEMDYSPVVQRLLGETEFWGREALIMIVESGLFPSRYSMSKCMLVRYMYIYCILFQTCH